MRAFRSAFTLIELLVVVAIIALLISILLPSFRGARDQGKRAKCLANMKSIAAGSVAYAAEDRRELAIPMHAMAASTQHMLGFTGSYTRNNGDSYTLGQMVLRLAIATSFGGRTPQVGLRDNNGALWNVMMDPVENTSGSDRWVARTRPLNKYVMGTNEESDSKSVAMYHCPADSGYPEHRLNLDGPRSVNDIPTYDFLGNSYRLHIAGYWWHGGNGVAGQFSVSVLGKAYSKLHDTGKLVMYGEPNFDNAARVLGEIPSAPDLIGWHKSRMKDNVAFADGSVRTTLGVQMIDWPTQLLADMQVATDNPWYFYLRRGDQWRSDTYPTPGTLVRMRDPAGAIVPTPPLPQAQARKWPYRAHNVID